jgi:hypothetical protein
MAGDLPDALHDLHARLLIVEHKLSLPMSIADKALVETMEQRRSDMGEAARLCTEAFHEAQAEAERAGSHEPIARFVRRLKRGEFDHYSH